MLSYNQFFYNKFTDIYKKYNYSCPITLEVREDDYIKNENYKATKLLVDKYIGGKGCEQ